MKFGLGQDIQIGDFSGIGANVDMPHDIVIGSHVMLGRQTHILLLIIHLIEKMFQ